MSSTGLDTNYTKPVPGTFLEMARVFRRAGPGSGRDFLLSMPQMAYHRLRATLRR